MCVSLVRNYFTHEELRPLCEIHDSHCFSKVYCKFEILYKSSSFIIATGDLTDGWKGTGLTKLQQNPQEWHSYYSIVTSAGFNSTFYWDTVGNHDLMTIDGRNDKNLYAKNYTVTGQDVTLDIFVRVFRTDYGSYRVVVFNPEWFFIYVGYG